MSATAYHIASLAIILIAAAFSAALSHAGAQYHWIAWAATVAAIIVYLVPVPKDKP